MLNQNLLLTGDDGYNLTKSLRFRSSASAYLNRINVSPTNANKWTWSGWVKRGTLGAQNSLFGAWKTSNGVVQCYFQSNDTLRFYASDSTNSTYVDYQTNAVYRDPSAWYHIVVGFDNTGTTASVNIYVNGTQITSFGTSSNILAQNSSVPFNTNGIASYIGQARSTANSAFGYLDGYQAEINFVDGQQLTPSSFGSTNATTGVWQPAKYTGTYGTNGFYLPFTDNSITTNSITGNTGIGKDFSGNGNYWTTNNISLATGTYSSLTSGSGTYTVPAGVTSLSYLVVAGGGGGSSGGGGAGGVLTGTMAVTAGQTIAYSIGAGGTGGNYGSSIPATNGSNTTFGSLTAIGGAGATFAGNNGTSGGSGSGGAGSGSGTTTGGAGTSGQGFAGGGNGGYTASPYPSGGGGGATAVGNNPASSTTSGAGGAGLTWINGSTYGGGGGGGTFSAGNPAGAGGAGGGGAGGSTGNGTAGTANTGGGGGGAPSSYIGGAGGSGIIIVGYGASTTYDSMTDVPTLTSTTTANTATLNPLDYVNTNTGSLTATNGNLLVTRSTTAYGGFPATMALPSSGKFAFEFTASQAFNGSTNEAYFGIGVQSNGTFTNSSATGYTGDYYTCVNITGGSGYLAKKISGGSVTNVYTGGGAVASGDVFQFLVDMTNGTVDVKKNGSAYGSQITGLPTSIPLYPYISLYGSVSMSANFGQQPFASTPTSGFVALNTYNLPSSTIVKGNKYMDVNTWTGTGATNVITNSGSMKPDFVWMKSRSNATYNMLTNSVTGSTKYLYSNDTLAEGTWTDQLTSFNSNGFTLGADTNGTTNYSGRTYVGWQWQAGQGTTSSNTNGSITSTVSVNASAGFSVVTYTGTSTGSSGTIGHGLGVTPSMVITKRRDGTSNWIVWHSALPSSDYILQLNNTAAQVNSNTDPSWLGGPCPAPNSTTFGANYVTGRNVNGQTCVAYCWAEVAGFSKFGSYTGNGSTDGPFIYCGFRPKFILIKQSSAAGEDWTIYDSARNTYNSTNSVLYADSSSAEFTSTSYVPIDLLSNGFKIRTDGTGRNANGSTYIYAAFAENPFKNALAR